MHPYGHPLHQKVLNHFIHIQDRSFIQSAVVPGLSLDIVVRFVPSCYPDSASSTHLHGFDGQRMHPYGHPLHQKLLKYCIYIKNRCVIQSEVVPGTDYVILVWFVYSCYPGPASLTHLHGFDEVRMHTYGHPLHWKVLKYFIYHSSRCCDNLDSDFFFFFF
jgi:hypothetical protein